MEVILDGRLLPDRASVHDFLAKELMFPDYYGRNLDALYDLLSAWPNPVTITVIYSDCLLENLGKYGKSLLNTLRDVSRDNENVSLTIYCEKSENNS